MKDLHTVLIEEAERRGVELGASDLRRLLHDLSRWLAREQERSVLRTADGSLTLFSTAYGEPYHSVSAGAIRECLLKFLHPSGLLERDRDRLRILDVGFGLGYNTAVAVYHLREKNPRVEVEILALEKELSDAVPPMPEPYRRTHERILSLLPSGEHDGVRIRLLEGDARETLPRTDFRADAVFHDPFSPYRNPELWSLEFLREVKLRMDPCGVWVSYTSSLPVRRALLDLGFRVGGSEPVGRKRSGTVASPAGKVSPLAPQELRKLRESPYSVPFRDPDLRRDPLRILVSYRISVLLREKGISSG